jgi:hypothetical protein
MKTVKTGPAVGEFTVIGTKWFARDPFRVYKRARACRTQQKHRDETGENLVK